MRAPVFLAAIILIAGCKNMPKIGEEAESGPKPVLYGYDDDAPRNPPDTCKDLGRVEVSIIGKGRFPEKEFRREATDRGGNGVANIRSAGNEDVFHGTKYMFKGTVVKCPEAPKAAAPVSTGAPK
jgi:hypothetical protein